MNKNKEKLDPIDWMSIGLAVVTAFAGSIRVFGADKLVAGIDDTTLKYFAVAGALLLLRRIKSLSFGGYKAEFQEIQERMAQVEEKSDDAAEEAKTAASMARFLAPTAAPVGTFEAKIEYGHVEDDPWKGVFGGQSEANGRKLRAEVVEAKNHEGWFRIRLTVESTDRSRPLERAVQFFIHNTFPNERPVVPVVDGVAELRLAGWGAFTVGVLADNGQTKLELDLADDRSFPALFRSR